MNIGYLIRVRMDLGLWVPAWFWDIIGRRSRWPPLLGCAFSLCKEIYCLILNKPNFNSIGPIIGRLKGWIVLLRLPAVANQAAALFVK
jgi:hypothetical protein